MKKKKESSKPDSKLSTISSYSQIALKAVATVYAPTSNTQALLLLHITLCTQHSQTLNFRLSAVSEMTSRCHFRLHLPGSRSGTAASVLSVGLISLFLALPFVPSLFLSSSLASWKLKIMFQLFNFWKHTCLAIRFASITKSYSIFHPPPKNPKNLGILQVLLNTLFHHVIAF